MDRQKIEEMENIGMGVRCLGKIKVRTIGYYVKVGPIYVAFP